MYQIVRFLRFRSLVPYIYTPCQRPTTNQGETKERPKNSEPQKVLFIKIAISFSPLIPCLIPPRELRENSEGTPTQLPAHKQCYFLRLRPKKVNPIPEKVDSHPKKVDSFPKSVALYSSPLHPIVYTLHQKNYSKKRFFLHISKEKCIFVASFSKARKQTGKITVNYIEAK